MGDSTELIMTVTIETKKWREKKKGKQEQIKTQTKSPNIHWHVTPPLPTSPHLNNSSLIIFMTTTPNSGLMRKSQKMCRYQSFLSSFAAKVTFYCNKISNTTHNILLSPPPTLSLLMTLPLFHWRSGEWYYQTLSTVLLFSLLMETDAFKVFLDSYI